MTHIDFLSRGLSGYAAEYGQAADHPDITPGPQQRRTLRLMEQMQTTINKVKKNRANAVEIIAQMRRPANIQLSEQHLQYVNNAVTQAVPKGIFTNNEHTAIINVLTHNLAHTTTLNQQLLDDTTRYNIEIAIVDAMVDLHGTLATKYFDMYNELPKDKQDEIDSIQLKSEQ